VLTCTSIVLCLCILPIDADLPWLGQLRWMVPFADPSATSTSLPSSSTPLSTSSSSSSSSSSSTTTDTSGTTPQPQGGRKRRAAMESTPIVSKESKIDTTTTTTALPTVVPPYLLSLPWKPSRTISYSSTWQPSIDTTELERRMAKLSRYASQLPKKYTAAIAHPFVVSMLCYDDDMGMFLMP
jgi:hypothetical protein